MLSPTHESVQAHTMEYDPFIKGQIWSRKTPKFRGNESRALHRVAAQNQVLPESDISLKIKSAHPGGKEGACFGAAGGHGFHVGRWMEGGREKGRAGGREREWEGEREMGDGGGWRGGGARTGLFSVCRLTTTRPNRPTSEPRFTLTDHPKRHGGQGESEI